MKRLAVLISNKGTGTNLQAIIDAIEQKKIDAKIVVVISDTKDAKGLARAKNHKIKNEIVYKKERLLKMLQKYNPDFVCLAGWKQIITSDVIYSFSNKILNLHPGLIPDVFDGIVYNPDNTKGIWNRGKLTDVAIKNFLVNNATYAGSTIHFLSSEFDFGPVLGRTFEKVQKNDTIESLYSRLKKRENELYIKVLQNLCN